MNSKSLCLLFLGLGLLLTPINNTFAQSTWETVDNLTPWRGRDIVTDLNGNFISLAIDNSTSSTGSVSTAVSLSADHGVTWQTVGLIAGYALELTAASDGTLFASGNRSATVSGKAVVWQSLDHGVTWTQSEPWAGRTGQFLCTDVAAGNSGTVYLCGYIYGGGRWVVRKGQQTAGGITWSTVDNISGTQPNSIFVQPSIAEQPDNILVCGNNGLWTVRRSSDGGATWTTLDSYSVSMPPGNPTAVTAGPDGSMYVVGRIATTTTVTNETIVKKKVVITTTTTTQYGLLVRKSGNGGTTWANVDYVANGWPANNITVDALGRVLTLGWMQDSTSDTWLVRGSSDGGATWTTTDLFLPAGTTRAHAMGLASDALGNVCVIGETGTSASTYAAPIRRLTTP